MTKAQSNTFKKAPHLESMHPELIRSTGLTYFVFLSISMLGLYWLNDRAIFTVPIGLFAIFGGVIWKDPYKYQIQFNLYSGLMGLLLSISLLQYTLLGLKYLRLPHSFDNLIIGSYILTLILVTILNALSNQNRLKQKNKRPSFGLLIIALTPGIGMAIGKLYLSSNPNQNSIILTLSVLSFILSLLISLTAQGIVKYYFIKKNIQSATISKKG